MWYGISRLKTAAIHVVCLAFRRSWRCVTDDTRTVLPARLLAAKVIVRALHLQSIVFAKPVYVSSSVKSAGPYDVSRIAQREQQQVRVDAPDLNAFLVPKKFGYKLALLSDFPDVATNLAWTPVGGDILYSSYLMASTCICTHPLALSLKTARTPGWPCLSYWLHCFSQSTGPAQCRDDS